MHLIGEQSRRNTASLHGTIYRIGNHRRRRSHAARPDTSNFSLAISSLANFPKEKERNRKKKGRGVCENIARISISHDIVVEDDECVECAMTHQHRSWNSSCDFPRGTLANYRNFVLSPPKVFENNSSNRNGRETIDWGLVSARRFDNLPTDL